MWPLHRGRTGRIQEFLRGRPHFGNLGKKHVSTFCSCGALGLGSKLLEVGWGGLFKRVSGSVISGSRGCLTPTRQDDPWSWSSTHPPTHPPTNPGSALHSSHNLHMLNSLLLHNDIHAGVFSARDREAQRATICLHRSCGRCTERTLSAFTGFKNPGHPQILMHRIQGGVRGRFHRPFSLTLQLQHSFVPRVQTREKSQIV